MVTRIFSELPDQFGYGSDDLLVLDQPVTSRIDRLKGGSEFRCKGLNKAQGSLEKKIRHTQSDLTDKKEELAKQQRSIDEMQ